MIEDTLRFVDEFEVRVVRKRVKSLRIRVMPPDGHVQASVPVRMPFSHVEQFIRSKRSWIVQQQEALRTSPQTTAALATPEEVREWRAVVSAFVPQLVARWEPIMGVRVKKLAYRNMKSRWGSCQPSTGRVCINVRLALYPPECLEYVVVHELCHLLEPSHGPRFHELMDGFLPDWRTARDKLKA